MSKQIHYPTFQDAQRLYTLYSTIESVSVLSKNLSKHIHASYLKQLKGKNIHEIYNKIILDYYPNEICVKAKFIKNVLINQPDAITIFELPVGSSRVDLCQFHQESIAYEIKTDLDNFSRLEKQIHDYYKIFEKVFVICSKSNVNSISQCIPESCGIYCYDTNYQFYLIRNAMNQNRMDPEQQLQLIRKNELYSYFLPGSSLTNRFDMISSILHNHTPDEINTIFKCVLKKRYQKQWDFLKTYYMSIYEIDFQWFYKNLIEPYRVYRI